MLFLLPLATTLIVEPIDRGLVPHGQPLSVGVDRKLDRRVAQLALDVGRALSLLEQQACVAVAQGVW